MFKVRVFVSYKESVLNPQAEVIEGAIHRLGYQTISNVKMGKYFDFDVEVISEEEAVEAASQVSDQLLANINMESYHIELMEAK